MDKTSGRFSAMLGCIGAGATLAIHSFTNQVEVMIVAIILSGKHANVL